MKGGTLLLVEDLSEIRELVRLTVAPLGLQLHETNNVRDGWLYLERYKPDTVLLDVNLEAPRDGLELCKRIKASSFVDTRVILLSTASQAEDIRRGLSVGADDYITKPFSPAFLLNSLRPDKT